MRKRTTKKKSVRKSKAWVPHAKQIKMVELLINPNDRRTKEAKCEEVGISPKTLWEWMKKPEFVEYMNSQLGKYTDAELPEFWKALILSVKRQNVSAMRLYAEIKGLLSETKVTVKQEHSGPNGGPIEVINYQYLSDEELENELRKYET